MKILTTPSCFVEELIEQVDEHAPMSDREFWSDLLVDLAEEYEDEHYQSGHPPCPML